MTDKPTLLFIAPFFMPRNYGGAVQLFDQLLRRLRDWDVVVLAQREGADPAAMAQFDAGAPASRGYRVARLDRFSVHYRSASRAGRLLEVFQGFFGIRRQFDRAVHDLSPDLVFCGEAFEAGWLLGRLPKKTALVNYVLGEELTMKTVFGPLTAWMRRRQLVAYRRAGLDVGISRFSIDKLRQLTGVADEKILFVPCFVDADRFRPPGDRAALRRELGWEGRTVLLTVARLVRRKGMDNVLRAIAQARDAMPADLLYVVGGQGPDERYLKQLAGDLGLSDRVQFIGFVSGEDLPRLYGAADLFVQTNRDVDGDTEGFGIVFLEANACGTAVLGGHDGGTGDAIEDGATGRRVDGADARAIAQALAEMLGDRKLLREMGEAGRRRVIDQFSSETQARKLSEILMELVARRAGRENGARV